MEIQKTWQDDMPHDIILDKMLESANFAKKQSMLPLRKIRSNILISLVLAVLITVFYVVLLAFVPYWQVLTVLALLSVYNVVLMVQSWKMYKSIPEFINPMNSLKDELTKQYNSITIWWKLQERISLLIYPIAIAGGFIWGGAIGAGKPIDTLLSSWKILSFLAVTIVVFTPLSYLAARWMFHLYFGKHLNKMQQLINELEIESELIK